MFSDHEFVTLDVDLSHIFYFGPGVWKFNNSLLEDHVYCALITDLIDQHLSFKHVFVSVKDFWESLKEVFRNSTINYSRAKGRELSGDRVHLVKLKFRLVNGDDSVKSEILELESELSAIFRQELDGIKICSWAKWLEEGETPSHFFFKLGREGFDRNFVSSMYNLNGAEVSDRAGLIKAHEDFYAYLFSHDDQFIYATRVVFKSFASPFRRRSG